MPRFQAPSPIYLGPPAHSSGLDNKPIKRVVIHSTVSPCVPGGARNIAAYFRSPSAGGSAHYCLTPETRVLTEQMIWLPIGDLREGDRLVGLDEHAAPPHPRYLRPSEVEVVRRRETECVEVEMEDGRVVTCSLDHRWLTKCVRGKRAGSWDWRAAEDLAPGAVLSVPLTPWAKGDMGMAWLGGLIDGEGCYSKNNGRLVVSQKEGLVLDRARAVLDEHEIPYRISDNGHGVKVVGISGLQATMRVLGQTRPVRFLPRNIWEGKPLGSRVYSPAMQVVAVRPAGVREVVSIQTSTRTFFAEGMTSHNCVDPEETVQAAYDSVDCWHAPPSEHTLGIEMCDIPGPVPDDKPGTARWKALRKSWRWAKPNQVAMLDRTARLTAQLCLAYEVPIRFLDVESLKAAGAHGARGITTHANTSLAYGQSVHWDPGWWPRYDFMRRVRKHAKRLREQAR